VAIVPLFPEQVAQELSAVASAVGGALLISPAGDITIVRGEVTPDGAHLARTSAYRAAISASCATVHCDDGSRVDVITLSEGWMLAAQTRPGSQRSTGLNALVLRWARNNLNLWLGYTQLPRPGGRDSGQSGAPAEVFAERPRKQRN
jgi:hypothetical protein